MDILIQILGVLHLIMFLFTATYVLIFPSLVWFDKIFIIYFLVVNIHWFFLNGECLIAYIYTKYFTKSYTLGENPSQNLDIANILKNIIPVRYIDFVILVLLAFYLINICIVLIRNNFNYILTIILIVSYTVYIAMLRINLNFAQQYLYVHFIIYTIALCLYLTSLMPKQQTK
jgi:hypothetical protein